MNRLLLAYFVARAFVELAVAGDIRQDVWAFAGIIGLSLALNGGICKPVRAPAPVAKPIPIRVRHPLRPAPGFLRGSSSPAPTANGGLKKCSTPRPCGRIIARVLTKDDVGIGAVFSLNVAALQKRTRQRISQACLAFVEN